MSVPKVTISSLDEAVRLLMAPDIIDDLEHLQSIMPTLEELREEQPDLFTFFTNMMVYYKMQGVDTITIKEMFLYACIAMYSYRVQEEKDRVNDIFRGKNDADENV